jgi:hypothetical protein
VLLPPGVALSRGAIHASFYETEERSLLPAGAITLPDMCPVAVHFVMEGVEDGNMVLAVAIDCIGKKLEAGTVASTVIPSRMPPGGNEKEIGVDSFME